MAWRLAKSLEQLRTQINVSYPNRLKVSDGTVGDLSHAARVSDHNPGSDGVVEALDITHDVTHGVDTWKIAEILRQNKDRRVEYVISNGRIFYAGGSKPWQWQKYTGANSHSQHIHVSVHPSPNIYDQAGPWKLDTVGPTIPAPALPKPRGITDDMRQRMMLVVLGYEGRFKDGKLEVYVAPDGLPEIGGITQKDHAATYRKLKELLDAGLQDVLRDEVLKHYDQYTDPAQNWTDRAGLEFFLRDCILNRGPTGAAEILQTALGVKVDHQVGPTTRGALAALDVNVAIDKLRVARERYEEKKYGKQYRIERRQWEGLVNRWDKAQAQAKQFQDEQELAPVQPAVLDPVSIRIPTPSLPPISQLSVWDRLKVWWFG